MSHTQYYHINKSSLTRRNPERNRSSLAGSVILNSYAGPIDYVLILCVLTLIGFGTLMVFSTTALSSIETGASSVSFLQKHLMGIFLGTLIGFVSFKIKPTTWKSFSVPLIIISFALLLMVLVAGKTAGGATRWIQFGPLRVQPGEFVKLAVLISIASYADKFKDRLGSFLYGVLIPGLFLSIFGALLLLQPDFGSTAVIFFVAGAQLLLVVTLSHFVSVGALAVVAGGFLVALSPYRMRRFLAFLDPFSDPSSSGYQLIQSLIAVGSGGLWGEGLGVGRQKLYYLPAAHTDFIYAVIAEEFGLIGAVSILILFLAILYRGMRIALRLSQSVFLSLLAVGLTLIIVLPSLLNMGVVLGLLPTKGLVLPFISYGGTAMIISCISIGILIRLSTEHIETEEDT